MAIKGRSSLVEEFPKCFANDDVFAERPPEKYTTAKQQLDELARQVHGRSS